MASFGNGWPFTLTASTFRTAFNKPAKTNLRTFRDQPLNAAGYSRLRPRARLHPPYSCIAGLKAACAFAACSES